MGQLVVSGSVNADHVLRVPVFPRPGETLHGHDYQVIPGGKGANQAVAAARLGAEIGFIACVGDDSFGLEIRQSFQKDGINIDAVTVIPDCPTGIAMIQVSDAGENAICISAEANAHLSPDIVSAQTTLISQAAYLLIQLETPVDGVLRAVQLAQQSGTKVVLNPAPARHLPDELLACVDIITPNETEAELLTGIVVEDEQSAALAAAKLHEKEISTVMITLGAKGVWISEAGQGRLIPGFRVEAVDTTAAGDTFNGAFVTALIEGQSTEEAIRFAHAAAAISVTRFGAQTSIPVREEVLHFLSEHQSQ